MSDERTTEDSIHTLTAAYALDALTDDERAAFVAHLAECDSCATETAQLTATASRLALLTEEPAPDRLRASVLDAVARTPQGVPPGADAPPAVLDLDARRSTRRRWVASVGGALAAAAAIATAVVLINNDDPIEQILAASDARSITGQVAGGGEATLVVSAAEDGGVITFEGLPDPGEGRSYQMWLIDGIGAPVPEDTFAPAGSGSVSVLLEDAPGVDAVALTIEPEGGSDAPTTDPIAVLALDS